MKSSSFGKAEKNYGTGQCSALKSESEKHDRLSTTGHVL